MKSNIVTLNEHRYQIGRVKPEVGSFILLKLLSANIRAGALAKDEQAQPSKLQPSKDAPTDEEMVRATIFGAFLSGLKFDEFKFVQQSCMQSVTWLSNPRAQGAPMPIMNDYGEWAFSEISDNIGLVMQLTTEVLVWNLEGFFAAGGLAILMGPAIKPATSQPPSQL